MMQRVLLVLAVFTITTAPVAAWQDVSEVRKPRIDPLSRNFLNPFMDDFLSPADAGLQVEEVRITNSGGETLRAWFLPKENATHTVMFCMGNTGNISCMLMYARILHDGGHNVLLFDYQGFGGSTGTATAMSLLGDSLSAYDYLTQTRGLRPETIGVFGVSLGSALALAVATEREVAAVAVEDVLLPNQKIEEVRRQLPRDIATQMAISAVQTLVIPRVDPLVTVPKLKCPLFLMHGERDWLLPPSSSIQVAQRATVPTRLWIMQGAGHAPETLEVNELEYASQLQRFFRDAFAGKVDEPKVKFTTQGSDKNWQTDMQFESSDNQAWQICLAGAGRQFHFIRRFVDGSFRESIPSAFEPTHVSVIAFEHAGNSEDGHWRPALSELSQELARFRAFEADVWNTFPTDARLRFTPGGYRREQVRSSRVWSEIRDQLPQPRSVHPRVRPRYGELLSFLYQEIPADQQPGAIQMLEAARSFLPDEPSKHFQLDNAGFRVAERGGWSFWTLIALARARHTDGRIDEARALLREALPYNAYPSITTDCIDALPANGDFFLAIGLDHLAETPRQNLPVSGQ